MKIRSVLLLSSVLAASAAAADTTGSQTLAILPDVPVVNVPPQPAQRHLFQLPSLEYLFRVEARCDSDWTAESLSLNVADSRMTRSAADLADSPEQQLGMQIPANQLAPLAMRDFCVIEEAGEGSGADGGLPATATSAAAVPEPPAAGRVTARRLTISAALSAHASLRCSNGEEQKTVYISQPLDVILACELPVSANPMTME